MTKKEALIEARRRWGENAYIEKRKIADPLHLIGDCRVGIIRQAYFTFTEIRGDGNTWEIAFERATKAGYK